MSVLLLTGYGDITLAFPRLKVLILLMGAGVVIGVIVVAAVPIESDF
jgi:hypothetical protein